MGARFRLRAAHARGRQPVLSSCPGFRPELPLPPPREAERRIGAKHRGTFFEKAPRLPPSGRQAAHSRRSTAAVFHAIPVLRRRTGGPYPHVIQAALAPCLSSKRVPAIQGSPLIGGGRYPSLLGRDCEPRLQAPHPAPPNRRL